REDRVKSHCGLHKSENATIPASLRFLSVEPLLEDLGEIDLRGIHWVIVGGKSGAGARPIRKGGITSLRAQWRRAGARFFFKQWGGFSKSRSGRLLDGRTWDEMPNRSMTATLDDDRRQELLRGVEERARRWSRRATELSGSA